VGTSFSRKLILRAPLSIYRNRVPLEAITSSITWHMASDRLFNTSSVTGSRIARRETRAMLRYIVVAYRHPGPGERRDGRTGRP
jgi:hypothetical protein